MSEFLSNVKVDTFLFIIDMFVLIEPIFKACVFIRQSIYHLCKWHLDSWSDICNATVKGMLCKGEN